MTQNLPPPPDRLVLDWLLSALDRRLYFAAEMGVLACLEYPPDRYAQFVNLHVARPLNALAEVLRFAAAEAGIEAAVKPLDGVATWAKVFVASMLKAGLYRTLRPDELRDAADRFGGSWLTLRRCLEESADALGVQSSFRRDMPPEREARIREGLDHLSVDLQTERDRRPAPPA